MAASRTASGSAHPARGALAIILLLVLLGCSVAPPATPGPSGSAASPGPTAGSAEVPSGPSTASLIQQAVDEGRLDRVTGLLYRAYSALGMPGVPEEFAAGAALPDGGVFMTMLMLMEDLSPEDQARLRPFVVRPTDPDSIFHSEPTAMTGAVAEGDVHPTAPCSTWKSSEDLDTRFKVWACADRDAQDAELDIATVAAMLDTIWAPMTAAVPDGMGNPKPDGSGPNISADVGGDARIDFYLLDLGLAIRRDGEDNDIPSTAIAAAIGSPPKTGKAMSGFVLVNRSRLDDEIVMKQDLIHEFFHVLQYAHNVDAPFAGPQANWFVEASATWAETWYDRSNSEIPHAWFTAFQTYRSGLEHADPDHQYAAYIWPFFMQQQNGSTAIFKAWKGIESVGRGDFAGVTEAVSQQLPFDTNFHEFAVRNLNFSTILSQAGQKQYDDADSNFWENAPPRYVTDADIVPGAPYISPPGGAAPLAADYYNFAVAEASREVTISIVNVSPTDQVDGDALVHVVGGNWERRPLTGRMLKFCRDNPSDDIDQVFLIVSNHGRQAGLSGSVEASAKETCNRDLHLGGTIHWQEESLYLIDRDDMPDWRRDVLITGTANVVLLVRDASIYDITAERGGGSTYSYDYVFRESGDPGAYVCESHEEGTLETWGGVPDADFGDWSIGRLNVGGPLGEDLYVDIDIRDWCGESMGSNIPEELRNTSFAGFPVCPETGALNAIFDGAGSYTINCSWSWDRSADTTTDTGSISVSGTLSMLDGPHPTPTP